MTGTALLALMAAGSALGAHLLTRARWTWRTPRTAIALWQALGLAWGLASIGTLLGFGVAPYDRGIARGRRPRLRRRPARCPRSGWPPSRPG